MAIITFKDIYSAAINRVGEKTTNTNLVGWLKDWINFRYKKVCSLAQWPFLTDHATIAAIDKYTTGTVSITTDTSSVTGSSTVWTKDMADRKFKTNDEDQVIRISDVSGNTAITLTDTFYGDTVSAGAYTIFKDEYLCPIEWEDIQLMRCMRDNRVLDKESYREIYEEAPNPYASSSDPTMYCILETRKLTKIGVDTFAGGTISNVSIDHWFSGANGAYGWVKKTGTDADSNDWLYLQILYGSLTDDEAITFYSDVGSTATGVTCAIDQSSYTEGNVGNVLSVCLNPAPYRNTLYECIVKLKTIDLVLDTDEPYIPEDYRDILFYFAIADLYDYRKKAADRDKWEMKAMGRINQMASRLKIKMRTAPRLRPAYSRRSYK